LSPGTDSSRITTNNHARQVLSRKSGVITGDDVLKLFQHAKDNGYAIPAINVGFSKFDSESSANKLR
jgi:hypothetical protein